MDVCYVFPQVGMVCTFSPLEGVVPSTPYSPEGGDQVPLARDDGSVRHRNSPPPLPGRRESSVGILIPQQMAARFVSGWIYLWEEEDLGPQGSGMHGVRPHLTFLISLPLAGQRGRGSSNGQNRDEKKI